MDVEEPNIPAEPVELTKPKEKSIPGTAMETLYATVLVNGQYRKTLESMGVETTTDLMELTPNEVNAKGLNPVCRKRIRNLQLWGRKDGVVCSPEMWESLTEEAFDAFRQMLIVNDEATPPRTGQGSGASRQWNVDFVGDDSGDRYAGRGGAGTATG